MIRIALIALAACLMTFSALAQEENCDRPWPVLIPEETPNKETMLELQRKVKDYLASAEEYLACNEEAQGNILLDPSDPDSVAAAQEELDKLQRRFNNTVDEMHVVGENFNKQVRAYKASQDG